MTKNEYPHFNPQSYDVNVKIATVRTSSHAKFNINYHLVWIPKFRRKMLVGRIVPVLKQILQSQCELMELDMLALVRKNPRSGRVLSTQNDVYLPRKNIRQMVRV